jgi:hypothetical protein
MWSAMFEAGRMPVDVYREQTRKHRLRHATVGRVYQEWQRERDREQARIASSEERELTVDGP